MAETIAMLLVAAASNSAVVAGFWIGANAAAINAVLLMAASAAYSTEQRRSAQRAARAAYNASLQDRQVMIRSAIAPRPVVYGRAPVSGPVVFACTSGAKKEYLHLVIALTGHECDAIEEVWFNDTLLPAPDGSGFIQSGPFARTITHSAVADATGVVVTLPVVPIRITSASAWVGTVMDGSAVATGYSLAGAVVTCDTVAGASSYIVNYENETGEPRVRVRSFLGGAGQTASTELVAESGGAWTSAHVGTGICYLYVRLQYDQEIFGQTGVPQIKCRVRGKKVYDPRSGLTVWSDNAALCAADYLRDPTHGLGSTAGEVPAAELTAAANICDETVVLDVLGATQKRYTTNGAIGTDASPRDNLGQLLDAMAGSAVWVQGRWLLRAGAYRAPDLTLTEDHLAGAALQIAPRRPRRELFNAVRGTFVDPAQRYAEVQYPTVINAGYETADGAERLETELPQPLCNHPLRAQRMAKIALERARQALHVRLQCNLRGYDLAPTDTVALTLSRYGWAAKVFEVRERSWDVGAGAMNYTLRETASSVWAWNYGEATVGDPAPNTNLPSPFVAPPYLTGLAAASGTAHLRRLGDGSIITQAWLSWNPSSDAFVFGGGSIEAQWKAPGDATWQSAPPVPGDSTGTYLGPLADGGLMLMRARPINAAGRSGAWITIAHAVVGKTAAPGNVAGLSATAANGDTVLKWTASADADYAHTELRVGASWAAGALLGHVAGTIATWVYAGSPGSFTVWAAHVDTSGNISATPASVTFSVAAPTLGGLNGAEGTKLAGIAAGATVGAPAGSLVGSTLAETVDAKLAGIAAGATVGAPAGSLVGSTLAQTVEANAANGGAAHTALTAAFTASVSGGNIDAGNGNANTGTDSATMGTRTISVSGGTGTLTYSYSVVSSEADRAGGAFISSFTGNSVTVSCVANDERISARIQATVIDANARIAIITFTAMGGYGTLP